MAKFSTLTWQCTPFAALSNYQLYDLLKLRTEIFVVEQNCAYLETDGKDQHAQTQHLIGSHQGEIICAARLLPAGLTFSTPSIGRVVVASKARSYGLGHQLLAKAIENIEQLWPNTAITIGAQYHLREFYRRHQFEEISSPYDEDGIQHIEMQRKTPCSINS